MIRLWLLFYDNNYNTITSMISKLFDKFLLFIFIFIDKSFIYYIFLFYCKKKAGFPWRTCSKCLMWTTSTLNPKWMKWSNMTAVWYLFSVNSLMAIIDKSWQRKSTTFCTRKDTSLSWSWLSHMIFLQISWERCANRYKYNSINLSLSVVWVKMSLPTDFLIDGMQINITNSFDLYHEWVKGSMTFLP